MLTNNQLLNIIRENGIKLKKLRLIQKMTQNSMKNRSGLARSQIINIEKGKTDYTISSYIKYVNALQNDTSILFVGHNPYFGGD